MWQLLLGRAASSVTAIVRQLADVAEHSFDIAIIGGGITGAGIARHASQVGLKTVLLEAHDFAAGTSSRSTKLIHGGLRYLAMGDIALVRETALERKSVLQMAPYLAEPRWMLVPAATRSELVKLRTGIGVYERLGAVERSDRHASWNAERLAREEPIFNSDTYPWVCAYREYLTDDARLVLATLRSAAGYGAHLCNYTAVTRIDQDAQGCTLSVEDRVADECFDLRAAVVVNATGPWVESVLGGTQKRLQLSKGVHIVVPHEKLPLNHMLVLNTSDGRSIFSIPRRHVTYVGTTDTHFPGGAGVWPEVALEDVEYLLAPLARYFRIPELKKADVMGAWAGLRALVHQPGKAPKEMSRKDEVWVQRRLISIAGGKLTSFRKMAETAMSAVGKILDKRLDMPEPLARLPGGDIDDVGKFRDEIARRYRLEGAVAERLVRLYGSEVPNLLGEQPQPVANSVFAEEIRWSLANESIVHLEDLLYRRLRVAWFDPTEVEPVLLAGAEIMGEHFHWSEAARQQEIDATRTRLAQDLGFVSR